jgi:hypothetical protein
MLIRAFGHVHVFAGPDPLVAPTWAVAVATIVLAVGAVITAVLAFLASGSRPRSWSSSRTRPQATGKTAAAWPPNGGASVPRWCT